MSPRAEWRLERFGFEVYDYTLGKVDWLAAGLPAIRAEPGPPRALDAADRDPATCGPDALVASLASESVIVVNERHVVLGRVHPAERPAANATAEMVMEPGPATVRAHEPLAELLERMRRRNVQEMIVSTPEGVLLGVVRQP